MKITRRQLQRLIRESCSLSPEEEELSPVEDLPAMLPPEAAPQEPVAPESTDPSANVPVPEDYQATRNFLDQNPDMIDLALQGIMDAVGSGCQRSTAQAVVDHMQDMLLGSGEDASPELGQSLMGLLGL